MSSLWMRNAASRHLDAFEVDGMVARGKVEVQQKLPSSLLSANVLNRGHSLHVSPVNFVGKRGGHNSSNSPRNADELKHHCFSSGGVVWGGYEGSASNHPTGGA